MTPPRPESADAALQELRMALSDASRTTELVRHLGAELRTLLNSLHDLLGLVHEASLAGKTRSYVDLAQGSLQQLSDTICNLLDWSRMDVDEVGVDPIAFSLRDSIGYTMGTLALRAHSRRVQLVNQIVDDVPDWVVGDPGVLRQIVMNLVDVAIRRSASKVLTLRVEVACQTAQGIELHGMVRGDVPKEPVSPAERWPAHSEGLSLMVATRLVELMQGRLWIEPVRNGTDHVVHFTVPMGLKTEPVSRATLPDAQRVFGLPVLLVDDDDASRHIVMELLTSWSFRPVAVAAGEDAVHHLEYAQQGGRPFPLAIFSATVSAGWAFDLAQQLQQRSPLQGTRVMLVTSVGQRGDAARCRACGIRAYLARPVSPSEFYDAIMTVLAPTPADAPTPVLITRHSLRERRGEPIGAPAWKSPSTSS